MSGQNLLLLGAVQQAVPDPYFEYTTLLLPGNGTNGAQNNTFLDSSTNAFSITRNGNTTQGTFSPFSQTGWGNYFDGSGDYLTVGSNAALGMGTGDFTVELWFYYTATPSNEFLFDFRYAGGSLLAAASGTFGVDVYVGAGNRSGGTVAANNWYHLAVTRSGSTCYVFLNGTQVGATFSDSTNLATGGVSIASRFNVPTQVFPGYISNFRVVKGTAVYTSNFTPSTTPLTAITNTSLLTCQSNRFIDNSANNFAITRNGDVSVQAFSPFNPTAAWSAATNGGSGYFDGSGDYLTLSGNPTLTTNFTIEFWFYMPSWGDRVFVAQGGGAASFSTSNGVAFQIYSTSTTFYAQWSNGAGSFAEINTATSGIATNAWHHVAIGNNGTTTRVWIDGVSVGTNTGTPTWGYPTTRSTYIGYISYSSSYVSLGYMAGVRMVTSDVYGAGNTTITVPTAPPTAITNTQLLCNFTNAGIYDATSKNDLETVGNAQISTTQSKFGGSSMYFDGTGDGQFTPNSPNLTLGTGDFTIEFWAYRVGNSVIQGLFDQRTAAANEVRPTIYITSGNNIAFYVSAADRITAALTQNAWVHVAVVRYSGSTKMYLNGVAQATTYSDTNNYLAPTSGTRIGYLVDGFSLNGYIQDFRLTKGIARYTSDFTPPTAAFPLL